MNPELDLNKALHFLLMQKHQSEYHIHMRQGGSPKGWTYPEWLARNNLVTDNGTNNMALFKALTTQVENLQRKKQ